MKKQWNVGILLFGKLMGETAAERTAATEEYPYDWRLKEAIEMQPIPTNLEEVPKMHLLPSNLFV